MNWFKDLFIRKDSQAETLPPIPEKKPNISEPVISFVETFKANPKRFKVVKNWDTLAITSCIPRQTEEVQRFVGSTFST